MAAPLNKLTCETDNPLITEERKKSSFDTDELAAVIHGRDYLKRRRELSAKVAQFPELLDSIHQAHLSRPEKVENAAKKSEALLRLLPKIGVSSSNAMEFYHVTNEVIGIEGFPLSLHAGMFIPTLLAQGDDEQQAEWLPKAYTMQILGTYAQTEMGHGTNLRKLETTATYDKKTQEFVLHTPTTTAMKWWPGNLGKSANHAIITAILLIDGKNYGPHTFVVQIRDMNTHMPLPGITVGEIGPKFDYNATDNGFLKFDHYRIPRRNMLMRHSKVSPEGVYTHPSHAKLAYSAMVHVRSMMISSQGFFAAYALIAAIRYSVIRKQGEIHPGAGEVKILDYQTQQHRLFPMLARTFAFVFTGYSTREIYYQVLKDIRSGKPGDLDDLHAITSGLKAVVTYHVGQAIEQARMACGGHGYSRASAIPQLYGVAIGGATYEGENMVMLLQAARYLVKAAGRARAGDMLSEMVAYLSAPAEKVSSIGRTADQPYLAHLRAFDHIARNQIFKAYDRLQGLIKKGMNKDDAWNANGVELQRASRLHTRRFIAHSFYEHVEGISNLAVRTVMRRVLYLHLNYELIDMADYLMKDGYVSGQQLDDMKEDMYRLLAEIRPDAVSLVDSWDVTDNELRSVLGRKDGHVYENLYKWAQDGELNRSQVLPSFEKYLKPMMENGKKMSKL